MEGRILSLFSCLALVAFVLAAPFVAGAATGTIDSTDRYAWNDNIGWIDFGSVQGAVTVGDTALSGYAWNEAVGWISLNCENTDSCATANYKVSNNGFGTLSGYAWNDSIGWINFSPTGGGVTVNGTTGVFTGYAWGENIGWVVFNCSTTDSCATVDYSVTTTWRVVLQAPAGSSGGGSAGGSPSAVVSNQSVPVVPIIAATTTTVSTSTASGISVIPSRSRSEGEPKDTSPAGKPWTVTDDMLAENPKIKYVFLRSLQRGYAGQDVMALQRFLNRNGCPVAPIPEAGSIGNETTYFGGATEKALVCYQGKVGIPATGYFGPMTRGHFNKLMLTE